MSRFSHEDKEYIFILGLIKIQIFEIFSEDPTSFKISTHFLTIGSANILISDYCAYRLKLVEDIVYINNQW